MRDRFEELLPYYVAQTLSEADRRAVEQYLRESKAARQSLAEWRAIARAIQAEATSHANQLPPLSPRLRAAIQQPQSAVSLEATVPVRSLPSLAETQRQVRGWRLPVTLAAALITMILFGGLVAFMVTRTPPQDASLSEGNGVSVALVTQTVTPLQPTVTATVIPAQPAVRDDMGILSVPFDPGAPASPTTALSNAAAAAATPGIGGGQLPPATIPDHAADTAPSLEIAPLSAGSNLNSNECLVSSRTGADVPVHRQASLDSEAVDTLRSGEVMRLWVTTGAGWYQVGRIGAGIAGWVPAGSVQLNGPCDTLPQPSPTMTGTLVIDEVCTARSPDGAVVNMLAGPGADYEMLNAFGGGDAPRVLARSDTGWYRLALSIGGAVWYGWVMAAQIDLRGQCDMLPLMAAAGYPPEISPLNPGTATPTPAFVPPATETVVPASSE